MLLGELYKIVEHVGTYSILLPVSICFIKFKALNNTLWVLLIYLITCILVDRLSLIYLPNDAKVNAIVNSFTIFEALVFLLIYSFEFQNRKIKKLLLVTGIFFVIIALYAFMNKITKNDSVIISVEAVMINVISSLYFIKLINEITSEKLTSQYFFWINLGLLIYFSASLLLFLNGDFIQKCEPDTAILLWCIHAVAGIASNVLISIGVWNKKRILL